jgi:hypothetical protein
VTTPRLDLRFRVPSPELLTLPWRERLGAWDATEVAVRDIPVGPSRHLVRFVEADRRLWALKEMPLRVALREYEVLRELERRSLSAVRAAGLVIQPFPDTAILVTHFLERSWQYRRLLMRVPTSMRRHRERLLDAIATLLVDLHRNGVYWGDCSLANTLFRRDGQELQAWLVDAETAEIHAALTDGQRGLDLQIMVENIAGGLLDVAARLDEPDDVHEQLIAEAEGVVNRYHVVWELLHEAPLVELQDRDQVQARLRRLNDRGFAVEEVQLEPAGDAADDVSLRLRVAVGGRTFHAGRLRELTGLEVGEGQATILLNDLAAHHRRLAEQRQAPVSDDEAGRSWLTDVFSPGMERAHRAVGGTGDPVQAYCDLLEVRWLLSEQAGADVGDGPALDALARRAAPSESAATLGIVDVTTRELPAIQGPSS